MHLNNNVIIINKHQSLADIVTINIIIIIIIIIIISV